MQGQAQAAAAQGMALCYVGRLDFVKRKCTVELKVSSCARISPSVFLLWISKLLRTFYHIICCKLFLALRGDEWADLCKLQHMPYLESRLA